MTSTTATVTNTLYVIRDGTRTTAGAGARRRPIPAPTSIPSTAPRSTGFSGAATGRGWYQDATDPTQKIVTDVYRGRADRRLRVLRSRRTTRATAALTSTLYARDFTTGNSVLQSAGGAVVAGIDDIGAIAGVALIQGQAASGGPSSGDVRVQVTTMKGQVFSFGVKLTGGSSPKHRVSWRLLNRD